MSGPAAPSVSAVIATLNAERALGSCLAALRAQDYAGDLQIVIADGGSTDRTLAIAAENRATVVENPLRTGEAGKAGPIGLGVILLLCIACYFLFKSMSTHLRNVRQNFPSTPPAPARREPTGIASVETPGRIDETPPRPSAPGGPDTPARTDS